MVISLCYSIHFVLMLFFLSLLFFSPYMNRWEMSDSLLPCPLSLFLSFLPLLPLFLSFHCPFQSREGGTQTRRGEAIHQCIQWVDHYWLPREGSDYSFPSLLFSFPLVLNPKGIILYLPLLSSLPFISIFSNDSYGNVALLSSSSSLFKEEECLYLVPSFLSSSLLLVVYSISV